MTESEEPEKIELTKSGRKRRVLRRSYVGYPSDDYYGDE